MISRCITTKTCVVKEHEDYEGGVEDGEGDQQVVERVRHLLQKKSYQSSYNYFKDTISDPI